MNVPSGWGGAGSTDPYWLTPGARVVMIPPSSLIRSDEGHFLSIEICPDQTNFLSFADETAD